MAKSKQKVRRNQTNDPTRVGKSKYAMKKKRQRRGEYSTPVTIRVESDVHVEDFIRPTEFNGDHPLNPFNIRLERERGVSNANLPNFKSREE